MVSFFIQAFKEGRGLEPIYPYLLWEICKTRTYRYAPVSYKRISQRAPNVET